MSLSSLYSSDVGLAQVAQQRVRVSEAEFEQLNQQARAAGLGLLSVSYAPASQMPLQTPGGNQPKLAPPREGTETSPSVFGILTAMALELAQSVNQAQDAARAASFRSKQVSTEAHVGELEQLSQDYQQALLDLNGATQAVSDALQNYTQADGDYRRAEQAVQEAQARLDALPENDPGIEEARMSLLVAQEDLSYRSDLRASLKGMYGQAAGMLTVALEKVMELEKQLPYEMMKGMQKAAEPAEKEVSLVALMAELAMMIGDSNELQTELQTKRLRELSEKRIESMVEKSARQEQELAKQQAISKGVNCAMKIVGALIAVVSVVGAVFTGGASLVLAGAAVALMVADKITEKVTGTSLTARVMKPLMEHVLKPLMDVLSKAIGGMLEKMGVDKDTAAMVGNIIGSVIGAVMLAVGVAVAATVAKSAVEKIGSALSKMMGETISKLLPDVLKKVGSGIGSSFGKIAQAADRVRRSIGDPERVGNWLQMSANVLRAGGGVTQGASGAVIADSEKKSTNLGIDIKLADYDVEITNRGLQDVAQFFSRTQQEVLKLVEQMNAVLMSGLDARLFVLNQIGRVAV